jgi:hypothetical protein
MIIYTGAFISIVKLPSVTEEVQEEKFEYPDCTKKCDHSFLTKKAKFCPSCGKPIQLVTETFKTEHKWDMADVSEYLDGEDLEWCNGWGMENREVDRVLVPAWSGKWGQRHEVGYDGLVDKIPASTGYKAAFEKKWAKALRLLDGKGVKWIVKEGIVVYEQD